VRAFARAPAGERLLVIVPRLASALLGDATLPLIPAEKWGDTRVRLPAALVGQPWLGLFADPGIGGSQKQLALAQVLAELPFCVLYSPAPTTEEPPDEHRNED
jgi:(1->4)-alpha-D-glucan 1-alpha-D-glucosylmutase